MLNYFAVLPILSAASCIGLGIFTLFRNPRHPANIGFMLGMVGLAVAETGNSLVFISGIKGQTSLPGLQIALIGQTVLPPAWFFFSLVFARANYKEILSRWVPVLIGMGMVSVFFAFWTGSPKFFSFYLTTDNLKSNIFSSQAPLLIAGNLGRYFYIYMIIGLVLNLVHLENTFRASSGIKRWQIKYVIFGVGAILTFYIYLSTQVLLLSSLKTHTILSASVVILISVAIMAFFIIRHRLLDVDIFISRYIVYNSFTILIVGLYLLGIGLLAQGIKYFGIPFSDFFTTVFVFISILSLIIIFFTTGLRRKVQLFINRHFYKHKYEFRDKWMESIDKISTKKTTKETCETLIEMISETMGARDICLWLHNQQSNHYCPAQSGRAATTIQFSKLAIQSTPELAGKVIKDSHPLIRRIKAEMSPFILNNLRSNKPESTGDNKELADLVSATGAVLCAPLFVGQDLIGFILQGEDLSGEPYRQDDFELLKAITTQAAVQIKKIWLTLDLMAAKEVEGFHRLSSFVMHDLKNLTNSMSLISQNAKDNMNDPEFQQDAIITIDDTVVRMKKLINRLSSVPKSLKLLKEEVDLKDIVHNALKRMLLSEIKNVVVTNETDGLPPIYVDTESMEMIFLNLLTNAYDAIEREGIIKVQASLNGETVNVIISDNGSGMSKDFIENSLFQPFKTTKPEGFGIGLFQCKTIIEAHGGNIEVESEKGKGTIFIVKLPRKQAL